MYVNMVVQPFRVAGFIINLFQRAAVASDRLFEVLSLSIPRLLTRQAEPHLPTFRAISRYAIFPSAIQALSTNALTGVNR